MEALRNRIKMHVCVGKELMCSYICCIVIPIISFLFLFHFGFQFGQSYRKLSHHDN